MPERLPANGLIRFGAFEVDVRAGEVRKNGIRLKLQDQPFRVLQTLLAHPGAVVTRTELQQQIWPSDTFVDFERGLNNAVKRLREALSDSAESPRYIETLTKRGYRFIAAVEKRTDDLQAPLIADKAAEPVQIELPIKSPKNKLWSRTTMIGALALLLLALSTLGLNLRAVRARLFAKGDSTQIHSLAVLPIQNLSGDPGQEYFADAMTEELITELSRISALNVISRTSVMPYKGSKKSLPEIARELHADAIVEGSVLRSGDRVRVTAQLIYAAKDTNVWAQTYDRDLQDVLSLQSAVAQTIAGEIRVQVKPHESTHLNAVRPVNRKAFEAYLAGRDHFDRAGAVEFHNGREEEYRREIDKAVQSFRQSIQEDPNYLPAYLAIYDAVHIGGVVPRVDLFPLARKEIKRALELDDSLVQAHLDMARIEIQWDYDYEAAGKEYQQALELAPNSADIHFEYADYLSNLGRGEEHHREIERAQELDPTHYRDNPYIIFARNRTLDEDRDSLDLGGGDDWYSRGLLGKSYQIRGRYKEAVEQYIKTAEMLGYRDQAEILRHDYANGDYKRAIRDWMKEWEKMSQRQYTPPFWPAFLYANLGDKEDAFRWLEKAYQERNWCMLYLNIDPMWDPIRNDPRFAEYVRRAGLPEDYGQYAKQRQTEAQSR